jgi:hypothetical protein
VIVRISGEGQFVVPDDLLERLNELDNAVVAAVDAGDETAFRASWQEMLALVATEGSPLAEDELVESAIIMPPRDITLEEASVEFVGEGLIPE